jgi:hypothetical protein
MRAMTRAVLRASWWALAAGLAVAGCQQPCGFDIGGEGGLTLVVEDGGTSDGRLGPGAYKFVLTTELGALTWSCTVGGAQADADCETSQTLGAGEDAEEDATLLVAAHEVDGEFRVELALLTAGTTTGPEEVTARVERDGVVVAEETYAPEYVLSRAGGDGCGQTYVVDEAPTLMLSAP